MWGNVEELRTTSGTYSQEMQALAAVVSRVRSGDGGGGNGEE